MVGRRDWLDGIGVTTSESSTNRLQDLGVYVGLSALALASTLVVRRSSGSAFDRYVGAADPIHVVVGTVVAGGVALGWLRSQFGFHVLLGRATLRGIIVSAALASGFAVSVVVADALLRYPKDLNVPMPEALAFYPAAGYVAESVFHVLPLALTLLVLLPARGRLGKDRTVWLAVGLVAALEPTFHALSTGDLLSPLTAFTWAHVYAFSLAQFVVFRRYDFVSTVAMRLVYYALWHVLWGTVRLDVLF